MSRPRLGSRPWLKKAHVEETNPSEVPGDYLFTYLRTGFSQLCSERREKALTYAMMATWVRVAHFPSFNRHKSESTVLKTLQ